MRASDRPTRGNDGGARRDRTADLYNAIVALSQLSYGPVQSSGGRVDKGRAGVNIEPCPARAILLSFNTN